MAATLKRIRKIPVQFVFHRWSGALPRERERKSESRFCYALDDPSEFAMQIHPCWKSCKMARRCGVEVERRRRSVRPITYYTGLARSRNVRVSALATVGADLWVRARRTVSRLGRNGLRSC